MTDAINDFFFRFVALIDGSLVDFDKKATFYMKTEVACEKIEIDIADKHLYYL